MSKAKGKGGTGRGTDKKGWNRWQASAKRAKNTPKPYVSKGVKKAKEEAALKAKEEAKAAKAAAASDDSIEK
ncbi:hypothetical protein D3C73_614710 [compost metagenome]